MNVHPINEVTNVNRTQHVLHRDYETRGVLQLPKVGAYRYAAHPQTSIVCVAFAVNNQPVRLWFRAIPCRRNS